MNERLSPDASSWRLVNFLLIIDSDVAVKNHLVLKIFRSLHQPRIVLSETRPSVLVDLLRSLRKVAAPASRDRNENDDVCHPISYHRRHKVINEATIGADQRYRQFISSVSSHYSAFFALVSFGGYLSRLFVAVICQRRLSPLFAPVISRCYLSLLCLPFICRCCRSMLFVLLPLLPLICWC